MNDLCTEMAESWFLKADPSMVSLSAQIHLQEMGWRWAWDPRGARYVCGAPDEHVELLKLAQTPLPPDGCEVGAK